MEYPVINESEALDRLGDKDFLKELLQDFDQMKELKWNKFDELIQHDDTETIEFITHTIKGASGNLSLKAIFKTSSALSDAARQSDMDKIRTLFEELKIEVERFRAWLPEYLNS